MKSFLARRKKLFSLLTAIIVLTFIFAGTVSAGGGPERPFGFTAPSTKIISSTEKITLTALGLASNATAPDKIEIFLNGQTQTCANVFVCQMTAGPFAVSATTKMRYYAVITDNNLQTIRGNYFIIQKPAETPSPSNLTFEKIITSSHQLKPGQSFDLKIIAKDSSGIAKITIKLDGTIVKECFDNKECGTTVGPFGIANSGEHIYIFVVTNKKGESIEPSGKFWVNNPVTAEPQKPVDTTPPTVTVSVDKAQPLPTDLVIFTATASDNAVVKKISIIVNFKQVKTCENTTICVYTGGPFSELSFKNIPYAATAFDQAGNYGWTNYKALLKATPGDTTPPSVSVTATLTKALVQSNGYYGYDYDVRASISDDSGKVTKTTIYLQDYLNAKSAIVIKTCGELTSPNTCVYTSVTPLTYGHTYRVWAETIDPAGNKTISNIFSLPALDQISPTVTVESAKITGPSSGTTYGYEFSVKPTDDSGYIRQVQLFYQEVGSGNPSYVSKTCTNIRNNETCSFSGGGLALGKHYTVWAEVTDYADHKVSSEIKYLDVPATT